MKIDNGKRLLSIGLIFLLVLMVINTLSVFNLRSHLSEKIDEAKELAKPAELRLTVINAPCPDCVEVGDVAAAVKDSGATIVEENNLDAYSEAAMKLIARYSIKKLPTVIIGGEIKKTEIQGFMLVEDALVFDSQIPPYLDTKTNTVVGKVSAVIINDEGCGVCNSLDTVVTSLQQRGVVFENISYYHYTIPQAQGLIDSYKITKLPTIIVSEDIEAYPSIMQGLQESGLRPNKGYYVVEGGAPYVEVSTGETRGIVSLTMVDDKTCADCYDVKMHKQGLAQLGFAIGDEKTIDINSVDGVKLRIRYGLEKIPTIVLAGDVKIYKGFDQIWENIGSIEKDGVYVLRNPELLGQDILYKDLTTNQVVGMASSS